MAKSTAKAESLTRDLKDRLEFKGFTVTESKDSEGWPKLTINTNEASFRIESADAVSKDVFGNDLTAFTPHFIDFASRADAVGAFETAQFMTEVVKMGIDKMFVKTDATDLPTAEATAGTPITFDTRWPTKGA